MATYSAGSASIAIRPDLRNFRRRIQSQLKAIDVEFPVDVTPDMDAFAQKVNVGLARVDRELDIQVQAETGHAAAEIARLTHRRSLDVDVDVDTAGAAAQVAALQGQVSTLGSSLGMIGLYSGAIGGIGALAAGAVPAVSALAGGIVSMSGSLLVMPGMLAAAGAGMGAVLTGSMGLIDAFSEMNGDAEKFNEALAELSPNAANFVRSIKGMSSEWGEMQNAVQDDLFTGLSDSVERFSTVQLPGLQRGFSDINAEVNDGLRATMAQFSTEMAATDLSTVLDNTARSVDGLNYAAAPLSQIWMDVATVGSEYLPDMTRNLGLAAQRWSDLVSTARETGQLNEIIDGGLEAVDGFVEGLSDAGGILAGVFSAADQVGQPMVGTLGTALDLTNEWVNSLEGQDALVWFFTSTSDALYDLTPALGEVASVLVGTLIPGVAGFISGAAPGFNEFVGGLADGLDGAPENLAALGEGFGDILGAVAPLAPVLDTAVGLLGATGDVLSVVAAPLEVVAELLGDHPGLVTTAAVAWGAYKTVPGIVDKVTGSLSGVGGSAGSAVSGMRDVRDSFGEAYGYARQAHPEMGRVGSALSVIGGQGGVAAAGMDKAKGAVGGLIGALGGPWAVGLMVAGAAVAGIADAGQRAKDAEAELAGQASATAEAQDELTQAVAGTSGELGENGLAAAAKLAKAELTDFTAVGESMDGFFSSTLSLSDKFSMTTDEIRDHNDQMRITDDAYQQLKDTLGDMGLSVDDVNRIVAEGGPEYQELVNSLRGAGDAGNHAADQLEGTRQKILDAVDAARELDPGMREAADAVAVLADESSSAGDKLGALNDLLQIMGLAPKDAERAMRDASEAIAEVSQKAVDLADDSGVLGEALLGVDGSLDTTTTNGRALFDQLDELGSTLQNVAANGGDTQGTFAEMQPAIQALADEFGLTKERVLELGESFGLVPDRLDMLVNLEGADEADQQVFAIAARLGELPDGKQIQVDSLTDEAQQALEDIGVTVVALPNGNIGISVEDMSAIERLESVGIKTRELPGGHVAISDTTDANLARIEALGIEVAKDKHGNVIIADNSLSTVANVRGNLDGLTTRGTHYQEYVQVLKDITYAQSAGGTQPITGHMANGAVRYAADGLLSQQDAHIARGGDWLVWAEDETKGESFIPHAPEKRRRSTQILAETAGIFGMALVDRQGNMVRRDGTSVDQAGNTTFFANGAVRGTDEIDAFSRDLEGKPYVWGGVNWGDCSGAMSAIARFATGLAPFAGRFATGNMGDALRDMGFTMGRGGPGDLRFGWYNGGPYGGHTSGTLPNGVNVEMGGGRGNGQYGGSAAPASHSQYTDHAHIKVGTNYAGLNAALAAGGGNLAGNTFSIAGDVSNGYTTEFDASGFPSISGATPGGRRTSGGGASGSSSSRSSNAPKSWSEVAGIGASAWASGMVSDALGVFGIPDSPPVLNAYGQWVDATSPEAQARTIRHVDAEDVVELERDLATKQEELRIEQIKLGEMDDKTKESTRASAELRLRQKEQDIADLERELTQARVGALYEIKDDGTLGSKVGAQVGPTVGQQRQAVLGSLQEQLMEAVVGKIPTNRIPDAVRDPLQSFAEDLGVPLKLAMGGSVFGAGGPVADMIPALLSDREFVTRSLVADQARPLLEQMNANPAFARALNDAVATPARSTRGSMADGPTYNIVVQSVDEGIRKAEMMERRRITAMGH